MKITIDEAIEIISHMPHQNTIVITDKGRQALQLSLEALKRVKAKRLHFEVDIDRLLTGEGK